MDRNYMKRALQLSKKGCALTCPNPMVGAVIVKDGRIIGEGWHHGPGLPHAEVEALRLCREDPKGGTMYVTLEPCNHFGRTPPCTEAIINAGIAEVKIAVADPNPRVTGGGATRLREVGIKVETGVEQAEAREINQRFFYHCQTGRPWVIMKAAMSLDGKIATVGGESQWITGEKARHFVHELRSQVAAVLVGSGTLLQDNPQLTNRLVKSGGRQPLKILLDSELQVTAQHNLVSQNPQQLIVFCTQRAVKAKIEALQGLGVKVIQQNSGARVNLEEALATLGAFEIQSVLVEGGSEIFAGFSMQNLLNEYYLFYAPFFIGGSQAKGVIAGTGIDTLSAAHRLWVKSTRRVGSDILLHAYKEELQACLQD